MDFSKLAAERFSVRDFSPVPVEEEKISMILEAAKVAPTAVNFQPQMIYLLRTPSEVARLAAIRPIFGAPLAAIICYDDRISWKNSRADGHDSGEVDAAIVTTHMMLQAWELGIGSCWIGAFDPVQVAEAFGIPAHIHPVAILPLGYPAPGCSPSDRHSVRRPLPDFVKTI